jgi:hypothetical protein
MVDIVHSEEMQWYQPKGGHREEGVEFKALFTGEEGEANNYWFTLVQVRERYHTPPHMHMFDQVRFMIKGGFNFGAQEQPEGTVGYFTEGTEYEQSCDSYSFHLLLQCEGGSRTRYFSGRSMRGATEALKSTGAFEKGRYRYADGTEVDGYEAIYKHLTGTLPVYTKPRYERPVIMGPESFQWVDDAGAPGVKRRALGTFNERNLKLSMLAISSGSKARIKGDAGRTLIYTVSGQGTIADQPWSNGSSMRLDVDEEIEILASEDSQMFLIDLPVP